jgi:arylsulfatase A-like enzyme
MVPGSKGYRADLDGLRAIAVLSVILFHADIKLFEGGFVGVDIAPTLLDYMGEPPAWDMHGRSLRQVLENPDLSWDHPVLQIQTAYKFGEDTYTLPEAPEDRELIGVPWWISITEGRYKYIRNLTPGEIDELYDLNADPEEVTNLAGKPAFDKVRNDMRAKMDAELRRTGGPLFEELQSQPSNSMGSVPGLQR